ncbi:MAG: carbohydrate ABC transporter permease [Clostridiales bacterium]|jgi:ABC-type glycerol-3-phosphate transport system permease component|nr:carbohydrate ABC transporter permease [Clostridiales bacterium]
MEALKRKKIKVRTIDGLIAQSVLYTVVAAAIAATALPLLVTLFNSLKNDYEIMTGLLAPPKAFVFGNFKTAWDTVIGNILNSIALALIVAVANTLLGAANAYVFARKEFFLKRAIFNVYIFVMMIPAIVGMPILYRFIDNVGLMDNWFAILLPTVAGGQVAALFLFRAFIGQQPAAIYEAARVDGANDFRMFFTLTLPLAIPIVMLSAVTVFTGIYNDYLWPGLVMRTDKLSPLMPILQRLVLQYSRSGRGVPYAMYLISGIPLVFMTVIGMRYFQSGDFAAGMKL